MASRIPPLLDTYLRLPPETSLVLLSGVLGSTTNWLVLRYLYSLLSTPPDYILGQNVSSAHYAEGTGVVLVSFLRDYAFWKDGAGKLGVDLEMLAKKGKFLFVDGLVGLFHTSQAHAMKCPPGNSAKNKILSSLTLHQLYKELEDGVAHIQRSFPEQKIVLIVDQLDMLLAAAGGEISSQGIRETLLDIREKVHSCIITVSADEPLIKPQVTSLEREHAALAISLAHDAHLVISLRMLDTGTARDVSGVLRASSGGWDNGTGRVMKEQELLYFVTGDGGVRVFERGQ